MLLFVIFSCMDVAIVKENSAKLLTQCEIHLSFLVLKKWG